MLDQTIAMIQEAAKGKRAAVMLSFGKDSMVLADLIRQALKPDTFSAHRFPLPVIYYRDPWFPAKHSFAESVIKSWDMEVHSYPPTNCGIKCKEDNLELVSRYRFGYAAMDIPKNVCPPSEYPRRDYICGLNDWILQPKISDIEFKWDTVFIGHKSSDVDEFEGPVPLQDYKANVGDVTLVFPLRDWTDEDVWTHIESNHIPYQADRYKDRKEVDDKWLSNDYTHACTACIDPREAKDVYCPKLKQTVPNVSEFVLRLDSRPEYLLRGTLERKVA